jgi:hypothetical protein
LCGNLWQLIIVNGFSDVIKQPRFFLSVQFSNDLDFGAEMSNRQRDTLPPDSGAIYFYLRSMPGRARLATRAKRNEGG